MRRISADRYRAPAETAWRVLVLAALGYALVQLTMDLTAALRDGMLAYGPTARLSWYAGAALWAAAAAGFYLWAGRLIRHIFAVADEEDGQAPATVTVLPAGNKTREHARQVRG